MTELVTGYLRKVFSSGSSFKFSQKKKNIKKNIMLRRTETCIHFILKFNFIEKKNQIKVVGECHTHKLFGTFLFLMIMNECSTFRVE